MEKAYILISLGAPENISADACRSFLREFLGDKHVLSLPFPLRQLLSAHIAKKRASQYAQNLETICGGSIGNHPSISAARSLAIQIQSITGVKTFSAFRYGAQNIPDAFRAAKKAGASSVKALPLSPRRLLHNIKRIRRSRICSGGVWTRAGIQQVVFRQSGVHQPYSRLF